MFSEKDLIRAELRDELSKPGSFIGDIRFEIRDRYLYSTDASIYQVEPIGVLIPKNQEDLISAVEILARHKVPVLARGSGSSLAGQSIGPAVILDCTKHLNQCLEINRDEHWANVEPGMILSNLNRQAAKVGLQFGPDPASAERASMGGCISNNATGAHSILYGMTADHVISLDMLFADASQATVQAFTQQQARLLTPESSYGRFVQKAMEIREIHVGTIIQSWPKTWRRVSGYNLNYLLPWSPSRPPMWYQGDDSPYPPFTQDQIVLPALFTGAEGTLGVIQRAKVNLVARPAHTVLGALAFPSIRAACEDVQRILALGPSAVELIPRSIIQLAREVPGFARLVSVFDELRDGTEDPAAILIIEFSGSEPAALLQKIEKLGQRIIVAKSYIDQKKIWDVRKVGLGILMSRPGQPKPIAFIEDLSVSVEDLGYFVQELEKILESHNTTAEFYAHASAGCLHIRPILNITKAGDLKILREIAKQAVRLTLSLGGAVSGEHGDGLARSEWIRQAYGDQIYSALSDLKRAIDPDNLMNPGKIIAAPLLDDNLRVGVVRNEGWTPTFNFRDKSGEGLADAIDQCNGAGVCRKSDGLMCPSFQAIGEEVHATRGRANLLRGMIRGQLSTFEYAEDQVFHALDLCLACKGCKAECPSSVDMAKLKYEFLNQYYQRHSRKIRDYLFAYVDVFARLGYPFRRLVNLLTQSHLAQSFFQPLLQISGQRKFPAFASRTSTTQFSRSENHLLSNKERVFYLLDTFHQFFYPGPAVAGYSLLKASGQSITLLPYNGAGRTLISKGFLQSARDHMVRLVDWLKAQDPEGRIPIVGVEPSEIYSLCDEIVDLLPGDSYVRQLQNRAWTIEEYLIRCGASNERRFKPGESTQARQSDVVLHGHCYQKAQPPRADGEPSGVEAAVELLSLVGYHVKVLDTGCCGMAGAFGYEIEHYEVSQQIGRLKLFPALAQSAGAIVAVCGVSCRAQIADALGIKAFHPLELVEAALKKAEPD